MPLNTALRARMTEFNIGNKELSEKSGVPLRTVNNILSGITKSPSVNIVMDMAVALGCTVDDLLRDTEPTTIAAHHDSEEWTEDEINEIDRFKEYVKSKRK